MPTILGTPGDDVLIGTSGDDRIEGFAGRDILYGAGGADEMFGGADDDVYSVDNVGDRIRELSNEGNDIVYSSISFTLILLIGQSSVETLSTIQHSDTTPIDLEGPVTTILGNYGNNVLREGRNLYGFLGDDTYVWDLTFAGAVFEAAGEGNDQVLTNTDFTLGAGQSVESIAGFNPARTIGMALTGNAFAQTITGNAGADTLDSGVGAADVLTGLGGNDIYRIRNQGDQVVEAAGGGTDTIVASFSFDLNSVANVENLSAEAGTAAIALFGNAQDNVLAGNAGNNTLDGAGGVDTLRGGAGDDIYIVHSQLDRVLETPEEGNDIVYTSVSYTLQTAPSQSVETLSTRVHAATTAINLGGNDFANTLIGNFGDNVLNGLGGADTMIGLAGNDTYIVDLDYDAVMDDPGDAIVEAQSGGSDIVYALVSYALTAGAEVETLSTSVHGATGAINLTGNEFGQAIYGNFGANSLDGKGGGDTLFGFNGADIFAFTTALGAGNVDTVADFSAADDTIALDDAVFTALGAPGALNPNAFVTGAAAADADDRIVYNSATGQLFYDADGNGGGAAVLFATLTGAPALGAGDFTVI
ncbi:MAG TPA: calcium-binding protein [Allosphingosinicella sp.]|nr:calcium-binding protein [Allosphingosinicella sp.]